MRSAGNNLISIVVPVFNEAESLPELIRLITAAFAKMRFEIVFIDDGSTDNSFDVMQRERKKFSLPITIVRLRKRCGKSTALFQGFQHIRGDIVVTLDADLQDDPAEAAKLMGSLSKGYDLVVGWRKVRHDSKGKLGVSRVFNRAVSLFTGLTLHDMNCGLKVMRAQVARELQLYGQLHRFIPVLVHTRGFRVTEREISHHPRKYGTSKFGLERAFASFDLVTTLFLSGYGTRPLIVFGPAGFFLIILGLAALVYLTAVKLTGESIGTRPLLLLGVMFVLFGFQLLSTGLLGELIISVTGGEREAPVSQVITSYEDTV